MSKDIYIEVFEELVNDLMEQGYAHDDAYEKAEKMAYDKYRDRLADMADQERLRRKEER